MGSKRVERGVSVTARGRGLPWLAALVLCVAGCEQVDVIARPVPDNGGGAGGSLDAGRDARAGDASVVPDAAPDARAEDAGPDATTAEPMPCPYRLAPGPGGVPVAEVVTSGLARAICACTGYSSSGALTVLASGTGPTSGDVGVNESFDQQLSAVIAGSLIAGGADGISLGPEVVLEVGRDLETLGPLEGAMATVEVGGDARVGGRIDLLGLEVTGTLTQMPGEALQVASGARAGALRSEAVQVAPPCACDPAAVLDVAELVQEAAARAQPLPPSGPLPGMRCAEYVLDGGSVDDLVLSFSDSAALYVQGDLDLGSAAISVAADAALDLFIEGNLFVTPGRLELGDADAGAVRVHVGGSGTIELSAGGALHGALYAPGSELVLSGPFEVRGAVLVRRVAASNTLLVQHEPSLSSAP